MEGVNILVNGFKITGGFINNHGVAYVTGTTALGDQEFLSNSGGGGKGPLPLGVYTIGEVRRLAANDPKFAAYTRDGLAFFCPLSPKFQTDRTDIGIHPDGSVLGTLGCNGIMEKFNACFEALSRIEGQDFVVEDLRKKGA